MEALFLEHEGYFGALGAFLESAFGDKVDDILSSPEDLKRENGQKPEDGEALRFVSPKSKTRLSASSLDLASIPASRRKTMVPVSPDSSSHTRRGRTASLDSAGIFEGYGQSTDPITEH